MLSSVAVSKQLRLEYFIEAKHSDLVKGTRNR